MRNLEECMSAVGCESICGIVITHLHHDHYGGVESIQQKYGPGIPVYKSAIEHNTAWATLDGLKSRGLLSLFLDDAGEPKFHPKKIAAAAATTSTEEGSHKAGSLVPNPSSSSAGNVEEQNAMGSIWGQSEGLLSPEDLTKLGWLRDELGPEYHSCSDVLGGA